MVMKAGNYNLHSCDYPDVSRVCVSMSCDFVSINSFQIRLSLRAGPY